MSRTPCTRNAATFRERFSRLAGNSSFHRISGSDHRYVFLPLPVILPYLSHATSTLLPLFCHEETISDALQYIVTALPQLRTRYHITRGDRSIDPRRYGLTSTCRRNCAPGLHISTTNPAIFAADNKRVRNHFSSCPSSSHPSRVGLPVVEPLFEADFSRRR